MMKYDPEESVYVLLGDELKDIRAVREKYGKVCIFANKCSLRLRFMSGVRFREIRWTYPDIYVMRLLDFARENPDKLMLISATEKYKKLLLRIAPQIEHSYIVLL